MPRTTLLRQLLQQRHLTTHEAFAAQYERAAARLAELDRDPRLASLQVSPRQFDRWYGGELLTLPRPDACRVLEHMLGRPVSELFSTAYDGDSAHDRDEESSTGQQVTSAPPPREGDENPLDIVTRTRQLTASNADDATLAFLDSSLEGIASRYEQDGPYVLRPQARQVRQLAHTLLDGRQPPRTRRELFRLAARASGLLGYMAVNTGDFALSEAYCTEARELSREIGDLDTDLWACGTLSFTSITPAGTTRRTPARPRPSSEPRATPSASACSPTAGPGPSARPATGVPSSRPSDRHSASLTSTRYPSG
ncbi:hypothetical protein ACFY3E_32960 [Streptomyces griseorubiginosus]|uniref:hypothetical protein n=1 Tax=Streptomyces griseorubiginosus TaxID=67304 RepID=UPI00369B8F93